MITLRYRDLLVAVKLCRLHTLVAVAETEGVGSSRIGQLRNRALSSIRFGYLEDYLHSRPFHPRHVLERCAAHSGQSAEALCASLYESLANEIHQNGSDAPYWLSRTRAPFPHRRKSSFSFTGSITASSTTPSFTPPVTRCNRIPPRSLGPRVGAAIGRPLKAKLPARGKIVWNAQGRTGAHWAPLRCSGKQSTQIGPSRRGGQRPPAFPSSVPNGIRRSRCSRRARALKTRTHRDRFLTESSWWVLFFLCVRPPYSLGRGTVRTGRVFLSPCASLFKARYEFIPPRTAGGPSARPSRKPSSGRASIRWHRRGSEAPSHWFGSLRPSARGCCKT